MPSFSLRYPPRAFTGFIEDLKWLKDAVMEEDPPKDKLVDRLIEKLSIMIFHRFDMDHIYHI